jgi:hypothetical protein
LLLYTSGVVIKYIQFELSNVYRSKLINRGDIQYRVQGTRYERQERERDEEGGKMYNIESGVARDMLREYKL